MANKYGVNATKRDVTVPSDRIDGLDDGGKLRVFYDEYTLDAVLGTADTLFMMKLPKGFRVYDCICKSDDLGTTGLLNIGWQANGTDAADADGFFAALDVKTDATYKLSSATSPANAGMLTKFSEETQVVIVPTEATSASAGTIKLAIYGAVE